MNDQIWTVVEVETDRVCFQGTSRSEAEKAYMINHQREIERRDVEGQNPYYTFELRAGSKKNAGCEIVDSKTKEDIKQKMEEFIKGYIFAECEDVDDSREAFQDQLEYVLNEMGVELTLTELNELYDEIVPDIEKNVFV